MPAMLPTPEGTESCEPTVSGMFADCNRSGVFLFVCWFLHKMKINNEDTGLHWTTVYNTFTFSILYNDMSPVKTHEIMADTLLKETT